MNDWEKTRERGKTLLLVEGNHEKEALFHHLIRCYPELDIDEEHIKIYGTNIYVLHRAIVAEYGLDWSEQDVDLPYVISKDAEQIFQTDFVNILLIFDYERQDPFFSEETIHCLLDYFCDAADRGKLYINYPMVEAYEHFNTLPDPSYENLKIPTSLRPGSRYKAMVREMGIAKMMEFPQRLKKVLQQNYHVPDHQTGVLVEQLLTLHDITTVGENVQTIMTSALDAAELTRACHHLPKMLCKAGHLANQEPFWTFLRRMFSEIIIHNICKANKIQGGRYAITREELGAFFDAMNDALILQKQNEASRDDTSGFIWVLNTSVFFVADYNLSLIAPI